MAKRKVNTDTDINKESIIDSTEINDTTMTLDDMVGETEEIKIDEEIDGWDTSESTIEDFKLNLDGIKLTLVDTTDEPILTVEDFKIDHDLIELVETGLIGLVETGLIGELNLDTDIFNTVNKSFEEESVEDIVQSSKSESIIKLLKDFEDSIRFQNMIKKDQIKSLFFNIKSKL